MEKLLLIIAAACIILAVAIPLYRWSGGPQEIGALRPTPIETTHIRCWKPGDIEVDCVTGEELPWARK